MKTDMKRLALFALIGLVVVLLIIWFMISGPESYNSKSNFAPPRQTGESPKPGPGKG